ncbi:hypothetical protein FRC04_006840 [Tulasnella sp. 424]|nr:hypothetical protein FRC04_006840 [Tulasnella sp. 424]KAG8960395.1 hypothetical protein FRC05_006954 [Tulasnella sp. 425]
MKTSTSLALVVSVVAITSVNGGSLLNAVLRPRGADEVWGGVNITAAVLEVYNAISSPTCNLTDYCVQLRTAVVPRCLSLQGSAGCWCTLHDPIHYCAICMSSPPDNTTTADQTQAATVGHADYHKGCAAWQSYLNASAAGSLTTSVPPTTSAPLPTLTPTPVTQSSSSKSSVSGGAIAGIVIGGVAFLAVVISVTYLVSRCLTNQAARETARQSAYVGGPEKQSHMGSPATVPGYFGGTDGPGRKSNPNTPPPQPLPYQNQPMVAPAGTYPNQQPISPHSAYSNSALFPGSMGGRPDSMASDSTQAAQYQPMRQGSEFGAPGAQQPMQPMQPMQPQPQLAQYQNSNNRGSRPNLVSPPPPFSS